jgi:site-specific DNA-methyltransferase (adenine-specific)
MRGPRAHHPKPYIGEQTMLTQQVVQGDCKTVLQSLPDGSVDFVLTDPPYLGRFKDRNGRTLANDDNPAAVVGAYTELYRVLRRDSFCISFYGYPKLDAFVHAWTEAGFDTVGHIVWPKPYISSTRFVGVAHESCAPQKCHQAAARQYS